MSPRRPSLLAIVALLISISFLCGCGRKQPDDFHVYLKDAKGLTVQSPVQWRGVQVGYVSSISVEDGRVRVNVALNPDCRGQLRTGAKAKASRGFLGRGVPVLELFGGRDSAMPALPAGSEVPEAGLVETFSHKQIAVAAVVLVILAILFLLLKGIKKVIVFLVALAFLVFSIWFFRLKWQKYDTEILGPEIEAKLTEQANKILGSPEAQAVWESMRDDLTSVLEQAKKRGGTATDAAREKLGELLREKAAELKDQGKDAASDEVMRLKEQIEVLLGNLKAVKKTAQRASERSGTYTSRTDSAHSP